MPSDVMQDQDDRAPRRCGSSARHVEELELDVVGIAEDEHGDVVQASPALLEGLPGVGLVMVQPDGDAGSGVHEEHCVAAFLGAVVRERDRHPFSRKRRLIIEPEQDQRQGRASGASHVMPSGHP